MIPGGVFAVTQAWLHAQQPSGPQKLPVPLQDGFIQVSFLAITVFANLRGLNDAAAVGIVEKIIDFVKAGGSRMMKSK